MKPDSSIVESVKKRSAHLVGSAKVRQVRPLAKLVADQRSRVKDGLREHALFTLLAQTFQVLGDFSRVRIIWTLSQGELCVGDLARLLVMSQPSVSHHLRILRNMRLVRVRRNGRSLSYSIDDQHINRLLREGIEHAEELLR